MALFQRIAAGGLVLAGLTCVGTVAGAASIDLVESPLGVTEGEFLSEYAVDIFTRSVTQTARSTLAGEIVRDEDRIEIESIDVNSASAFTSSSIPSDADEIFSVTGVDTPNRFVIDFDRAFDFELNQILEDRSQFQTSFGFTFRRVDLDGAQEELLASSFGNSDGIAGAFSAGGFNLIGGAPVGFDFEEVRDANFGLRDDGTVFQRFETFDPLEGIDTSSFESLRIELSGRLPAGRYEISSEGTRASGARISSSRTDGFTFSAELVAEPAAVPTPSAALAGGLGLIGLLHRRRCG